MSTSATMPRANRLLDVTTAPLATVSQGGPCSTAQQAAQHTACTSGMSVHAAIYVLGATSCARSAGRSGAAAPQRLLVPAPVGAHERLPAFKVLASAAGSAATTPERQQGQWPQQNAPGCLPAPTYWRCTCERRDGRGQAGGAAGCGPGIHSGTGATASCVHVRRMAAKPIASSTACWELQMAPLPPF